MGDRDVDLPAVTALGAIVRRCCVRVVANKASTPVAEVLEGESAVGPELR